MKCTLLLLCPLIIGLSVAAQNKWNYATHDNLMELEGTEYVITSTNNNSKISVKSCSLNFINTRTGENAIVDFPDGAYINNVNHVKIDSLGINKMIIMGRINQLNKKKIDWDSPKQIIICSIDGGGKEQITDNSFFVSNYTVNKTTGVMVITGYWDINENGKYDKGDKTETLLFSLKEMKVIKRI